MKQQNLKVILCLVLSITVLYSNVASAEVPPHPPGSICFTPYFWCWLPPPGVQPGFACYCYSPGGPVAGVAG